MERKMPEDINAPKRLKNEKPNYYNWLKYKMKFEIGECLLSFRAESLVFQFTIQKRKD
jgi:hypothetical protein